MTIAVENTWGRWLRRYREQLGLSQDQFADEITLICAHMSREQVEQFHGLRLNCPKVLAGYEISRYENGKRTPIHRSTHLLFIWVLLNLHASLDSDTANQWLELGQQGWLTSREQLALFG